MVSAPISYLLNFMTPQNWILNEGGSHLKMTASWELVKLEDDPKVREIK